MDAILHAVGKAHDPARPLSVEVCVPVTENDPFSPNLAADAVEGRVDVAGPLIRGVNRTRLLHVVFETSDSTGSPRDELASVLVEDGVLLDALASRLPGLPPGTQHDSVELHLPESVMNKDHPEAGPTSDLSRATDQLVVQRKPKPGA